MQDLQKKKTNIKDDIERIKIKNEKNEAKQKGESDIDIIKKNIENDKQNNNDIINLDDYDGWRLLIDDNEEGENKNEYVSKYKIHFRKIGFPSNFDGKIPEYKKEKQEKLKKFKNMVVKNKIEDNEKYFDDEI